MNTLYTYLTPRDDRTIEEGTMEPTDIQDQTAADQTVDTVVDTAEFVEEELLVEEISIDGMCGVY